MDPKKRRELKQRRHRRLRFKVSGNAARPRLAVFKSLRHFYAQLIDDEAGRTIISASTLDKEFRGKAVIKRPTIAVCKDVADLLCSRAKDKGIEKVVFDHGGFGFRGRVKAFADRAREKGLHF